VDKGNGPMRDLFAAPYLTKRLAEDEKVQKHRRKITIKQGKT